MVILIVKLRDRILKNRKFKHTNIDHTHHLLLTIQKLRDRKYKPKQTYNRELQSLLDETLPSLIELH